MTLQVNRRMLPMKAHYFFFNAGTAPVVPFMPTLARQLGFSSIVVGTVYTILPIVGLLVKPLFGFVADRFRIRKQIFVACQLLTAIAFLGINFIGPAEQAAQLQFHCNDAVSDLRYCPVRPSDLDACAAAHLVDSERTELMRCRLQCRTNASASGAWCSHGRPTVDGECDMDPVVMDIPLRHLLHTSNGCLAMVIKNASIQPVDRPSRPLVCPHKATASGETPLAARCAVRCDDPDVQHTITAGRLDDRNAWLLPQFWAFFVCLLFSWVGMAAVVSLGDAICFALLGDQPERYGQQRLWGAVGWGCVSLLAGLLVDEMSRGRLLKDYSGVFYVTLALLLADAACSALMERTAPAVASANVWRDVGLLFVSPSVCVFFGWCAVIGLGTALVWNFLFWHLETLAVASAECGVGDWMKTLQGLTMVVQCFGGEIPFLFVSGAVLKRIGHVHAMSLVLGAFGVRFLLYSVLEDPWWVLPIEVMQGCTIGIFYATMASYASILAPPGTDSTLQGLVGAVFEGVGVSTGSFVAGYMIEHLGGSATFRWFGVAALVLMLVHVAAQKLLDKCTCGGRTTDGPTSPVDVGRKAGGSSAGSGVALVGERNA